MPIKLLVSDVDQGHANTCKSKIEDCPTFPKGEHDKENNRNL